MDFSLHKNPSLVENPSIVDDLALTKKSTIEEFQCTMDLHTYVYSIESFEAVEGGHTVFRAANAIILVSSGIAAITSYWLAAGLPSCCG